MKIMFNRPTKWGSRLDCGESITGGPNNWFQLQKISHHSSLFVYIVLVIMENHCHKIKHQMTKVHHLLVLLIETQFSYLQMRLIILPGIPQKRCEDDMGGQKQATYSATTVSQVSVRWFPHALSFNPHNNPHFRHHCLKTWLSGSHHVVAKLGFENLSVCLQGLHSPSSACLQLYLLLSVCICKITLKIGSYSTVIIQDCDLGLKVSPNFLTLFLCSQQSFYLEGFFLFL